MSRRRKKTENKHIASINTSFTTYPGTSCNVICWDILYQCWDNIL